MNKYSIYQEVKINNYKIVLFDWEEIPKNSPDIQRNVACFDKSGNMVWQIKKFSHYPGAYPKGACYYIGITLFNNELILSNSCDLRVVVDYKTGKVLEKKFVK